MIEVKNLTKRYGQNLALDRVSFKIEEGTIVGFLGPNGAGKSTAMNIITGYLSATSGEVTVSGKNTLEEPGEVKKMIGYLPELPPLYMDMTVKEYLYFMYELKKAKLPREQHIQEICRLVKIENVFNRLIANLSKGYKQRVGIAQALIGNPPVLILDEPTVGLDPKQIIEIRTLIKNLGRNHTVILSSHILPEVQAVCERILVINNGRIVADGATDTLAHDLSPDHRLILRVEGPEKEMVHALQNVPGVVDAYSLGEKEKGVFEVSVESTPDNDIRRDVFALMARKGWPMLALKNTDLTLEDLFLQLTSTDAALLQQIVVGAVNLSFTTLAIFTVDKFGRRPLMIIGALVMAVSMLALGSTFYFRAVGIGSLVCMLVYTAGFAMSWGPVCWVLLAEIFPNSVRSTVMSIAVASQWIANFLVSWSFPMLDKSEYLTEHFNHGMAYWIYGLMGILAALFIWRSITSSNDH